MRIFDTALNLYDYGMNATMDRYEPLSEYHRRTTARQRLLIEMADFAVPAAIIAVVVLL